MEATERLTWRDQLVDIALSGALTGLVQFQVWHGPITQIGDGPISGPKPLLALVGLAATASLAIRRRWPLLAASIAVGDGVLQPHIAPVMNFFEFFVALLLIVYSTAANTTGRRTWVGAGIIGTLLLIGSWPSMVAGNFSAQFGIFVFCGVAWLVGKTIQHRCELSKRLADRAATLEQTRDAEVETAVRDEARCSTT